MHQQRVWLQRGARGQGAGAAFEGDMFTTCGRLRRGDGGFSGGGLSGGGLGCVEYEHE